MGSGSKTLDSSRTMGIVTGGGNLIPGLMQERRSKKADEKKDAYTASQKAKKAVSTRRSQGFTTFEEKSKGEDYGYRGSLLGD